MFDWGGLRWELIFTDMTTIEDYNSYIFSPKSDDTVILCGSDGTINYFVNHINDIIYTTNSIESLNSSYRRLNRQRSVFPSSQALLKALYLATFEATKKWTMPLRNWGKVYGELSIMYPGRLPE